MKGFGKYRPLVKNHVEGGVIESHRTCIHTQVLDRTGYFGIFLRF